MICEYFHNVVMKSGLAGSLIVLAHFTLTIFTALVVVLQTQEFVAFLVLTLVATVLYEFSRRVDAGTYRDVDEHAPKRFVFVLCLFCFSFFLSSSSSSSSSVC